VVERHDRAPLGTFFAEGPLAAGATVELPESVAHHVRVKRLAAGDPIRLTNGAGTTASGMLERITKASVVASVASTAHVDPPRAIHLRVPIADRDRMLWLAEKATELGVASWQAVRWQRSLSVSPRGEGDAFRVKVRARMIAALEQSGGAWLPRILGDADARSIDVPRETLPLLLDASGGSIIGPGALADTVVAIGPEGGLTSDEVMALRAEGWRPTRLAATTLRFETAGIAAVACLRAASLSKEPLREG
jgi:16S rRNA (uracil1498-N3)-methyltransferase